MSDLEFSNANSDAYDERMHILNMIEQGIITSTQGAVLLRALEGQEEDDSDPTTDEDSDTLKPDQPKLDQLPEPEPDTYSSPPPAESRETKKHPRVDSSMPVSRLNKWRNWWYLPLAVGILITVFSGWLIFLGNLNGWAGFWMACIWLPLLFGIFAIMLSWASHHSLWLHVRVNTGQDEWPRRVAISMPLPLEFGAWVIRTFQDKIPGFPNLEDIPLDEIIMAVRNGVKPESPIHIQVEEKGAERVEVYIG